MYIYITLRVFALLVFKATAAIRSRHETTVVVLTPSSIGQRHRKRDAMDLFLSIPESEGDEAAVSAIRLSMYRRHR